MNWLVYIFKRSPDFIVGGPEDPYLLRWWIIPRNRFFNIYLHKFLRDDDDRALHDHPWVNLSFLIKGSYIEHLPYQYGRSGTRYFNAPSIIFRRAVHRHRIELVKSRWLCPDNDKTWVKKSLPAWTIFITGPKIREWGFWCSGWKFVHWKDFTTPTDKGKTGKGCG